MKRFISVIALIMTMLVLWRMTHPDVRAIGEAGNPSARRHYKAWEPNPNFQGAGYSRD